MVNDLNRLKSKVTTPVFKQINKHVITPLPHPTDTQQRYQLHKYVSVILDI